ncbi:Tfp pilus assembly protein PilF [Neolewinella xylanilytica]|uniref:Tfp pilus assembly protein PilF n=1 Tax=Neolewinella xylanilytica TaxID=1514080 RepID=A0A2S6I949_9BACT|nr:Tfp pilus assembly protein PilF [Neolewinella xylanilytica]
MTLQVIVASCASTKSREEQGVVAKLWHNTNSHYNGYFNAREIMDESLLALNEQHTDNYNQRLEMFPFLAVDNTGTVASELDRAIEKVAVVVKKHPFSNWTDDSYLLVGQAQLLKQDYEGAERTLDFAMKEFRPRPERSKRKKGSEAEGEEDEFESGREVEVSETQSRRDRIKAQREAQRERQRTIRQRQKERKAEQKAREKARKELIRARKKGIRLPSRNTPADTTALAGLENEPEETPEEAVELEEGPIGMISIFGNRSAADAGSGEYGSKPDSYLVKHRPAYQEIRLWLAWTLIKRDDYDRAQMILQDLRNDRGTFADVRRKAMAVQAYLYLEQDRLDEAIPFLESAAEVAEERNERARYYYIAGQLNQELSHPAAAVADFEQVVAAKPAYVLELGARISMAQNAYLSGGGSPGEALSQLERMTKEEKNLEYESQILYSMAGIALRSGDDAAGGEYLRRALNSPYSGPDTRVEAYRLLGDMAYEERDYLSAKQYYDSTLQSMPETDLRFAATSGRRDQLGNAAMQLQSIQRNDSLLRIATLPEAERRSWAEERFALSRATNSAALYSTPATRGSIPVTNAAASVSNSAFWGYNSQTIRRGRRDFERRWGDRSLEDNWRRSTRTNGNLFADEGDAGALVAGGMDAALVTEDEISRILADVPIDPEAQTATRAELAEAYFTLGREYRDRVEDNEYAIQAFETLDERFPDSPHEPESWYYLYLLHTDDGATGKATEYARRLQEKYPDSKFARLANDPNYAREMMDEAAGRMRDYERAYRAFEERDFAAAQSLIDSGTREIAADHPLRARYDLLSAMVAGKLEGRAAYIAGLQQVVADHENSPEQTRAREILRLLGESGARIPGQATAGQAVTAPFQDSPNEIHYMLIVFNNQEAKLNELKVELEDFNQKYNKLDRLRSTPIYIGRDNEIPMLVMRRFNNAMDAMTYYRNATEHRDEFLNGTEEGYTILPVSQSNYREILKARAIAGYDRWFEANYL